MKMNKRGDLLSLTGEELRGLILAALVIGGLFLLIPAIRNNYAYEMAFSARDMSLLLNSLYATSGNIDVNYQRQALDFGYTIEPNVVKVFEEEKVVLLDEETVIPLSLLQSYPFVQSINPAIQQITFHSKGRESGEWGPLDFSFTKTSQEMTISDILKPLPSQADAKVNTQQQDQKETDKKETTKEESQENPLPENKNKEEATP